MKWWLDDLPVKDVYDGLNVSLQQCLQCSLEMPRCRSSCGCMSWELPAMNALTGALGFPTPSSQCLTSALKTWCWSKRRSKVTDGALYPIDPYTHDLVDMRCAGFLRRMRGVLCIVSAALLPGAQRRQRCGTCKSKHILTSKAWFLWSIRQRNWMNGAGKGMLIQTLGVPHRTRRNCWRSTERAAMKSLLWVEWLITQQTTHNLNLILLNLHCGHMTYLFHRGYGRGVTPWWVECWV